MKIPTAHPIDVSGAVEAAGSIVGVATKSSSMLGEIISLGKSHDNSQTIQQGMTVVFQKAFWPFHASRKTK